MGPSLLKRSFLKMMGKKTKRWNKKLYLPDFGKPSDKMYCSFRNPEGSVRNLGQVRTWKYTTENWAALYRYGMTSSNG
jgi:hypothetical protein